METFTKEEAIKIQTEQLAQWKIVLKDEVYVELEKWATKHNDALPDDSMGGRRITRGSDLSNFVSNLMYGHKPETIYQEADITIKKLKEAQQH